MNDIETIKNRIFICKYKQVTDIVRILDQCEFLGTPFGSVCILQVFDYVEGEWITCTINKKAEYSIAYLYRFIRTEIEFDEPVRLSVASC